MLFCERGKQQMWLKVCARKAQEEGHSESQMQQRQRQREKVAATQAQMWLHET
jgi:hypothetical protein